MNISRAMISVLTAKFFKGRRYFGVHQLNEQIKENDKIHKKINTSLELNYRITYIGISLNIKFL